MAEYVVLGGGQTGRSVACYWLAQGHKVCLMDTRAEVPGLAAFCKQYPQLDCHQASINLHRCRSAARVCVSPGIAPHHPELKTYLATADNLCTDIDLFMEQQDKPVLAVTGSNGKSTVTMMTATLLRVQGFRVVVGGNIGCSVLDLLQQSYDYCVLELSSFQLFYSQEWPWAAAAVTNLASDHLDWHLSLAHYHRAKLRIFARAQCCVVNRADNAFLSYSEGINTVNGRVCSFGSDVPSHGHWGVSENDECHYMVQRGVWQSPIPSVSALMQHDWLNLQASYALAAVSGCESPDVEDFLECYKGLPHRCQSVLQQDGIVWINDSKGTNVAAACAAISCVAERTSGRVIVLLGGVPKENDFSALAAVLQVCDCFVIVFGQAAPLLHNELAGQPMAVVDTLRQAVDEAMVVAKSGDAVLLSPACASWDQFKDFSDRGQAFTDYVFRSYHEASH